MGALGVVLLPVSLKLQLANVFFPSSLGQWQWHLSIEYSVHGIQLDRHFAQCELFSLTRTDTYNCVLALSRNFPLSFSLFWNMFPKQAGVVKKTRPAPDIDSVSRKLKLGNTDIVTQNVNGFGTERLLSKNAYILFNQRTSLCIIPIDWQNQVGKKPTHQCAFSN